MGEEDEFDLSLSDPPCGASISTNSDLSAEHDNSLLISQSAIGSGENEGSKWKRNGSEFAELLISEIL